MDALKMQIICTIQLLADKLKKDISFNYLETMSLDNLFETQEAFLLEYNKMKEAE